MAAGGGGVTAASGSSPPKGYPTEIFEEINAKFQCAVCIKILRNAVQSFCGHRFCRECIEYKVSSNEEVTCFQCIAEDCVTEYSILKLNQMFPDNAIKRETANLPTRCSFTGCDWTGSFKDYEIHYLDCEWFPMDCALCGAVNPRKQFEQHSCADVGSSGENVCPYGCGQTVEGDITEHLRGQIIQHFDVMHQRLYRVETAVGSGAIVPGGRDLSGRIAQLERSLSELERSVAGKERGPSSSSSEGAVGGLNLSPATIESAIVATSEKMIVYENIITVLNREVEKLSERVGESVRRKNSEREFLDSTERKVKSLERMLAMKDATIAELDLRISSLEQTSYNGTLLWRIAEFQRKRQDAVSGRTTSMYSPNFYTSRTGYKMCARIYLNGDGMGKGTHVSLFFVVMRGSYDALLKWPFRQKVTLMLLDQSGREHVVDAFRPDQTSSSFKRPTTEMNVASGCPLLMPLSQLDSVTNAYVKDGVAFVKIVVSTDEL